MLIVITIRRVKRGHHPHLQDLLDLTHTQNSPRIQEGCLQKHRVFQRESEATIVGQRREDEAKRNN